MVHRLSTVSDNRMTSMPRARKPSKARNSVREGRGELAAILLLDATTEEKPVASDAVTGFIAFVKTTLGDARSNVRASDRLTDSAVCLVATDQGPDGSLENLCKAPAVVSATKPILEINARHAVVTALVELSDGEQSFKEDAAHLLFDEARVLDGRRPATPNASPSAWPG